MVSRGRGGSTRRRFLRAAAAVLALPPASRIGRTQSDYPAHSVRVVVPFPPGGAVDILARLITQKLSERLGQQFYIDNIGGAGGNIGVGHAARAAPDGYTVLFVFGSFAVAPSLFAKLSYDPLKDFAPVTLLVTTPTVLIVNSSVPARSVKELIDLVRANPGKYSYAHGGIGTQGHLAGEQFRLSLTLDLVPVPFGGASPANASVVAGHVAVGFSSLAALVPHLDQGRVRPLAVTSAMRARALPNVPTMAESGVPDIAGDTWVGVVVPAGTPLGIITLLHREIVDTLAQPDMTQRLVALGYEPVANAPEEFSQRLKSEIELWRTVIRRANIKPQ